MRYKFTFRMRGGRTEIHDADGYSVSGGIFLLHIHKPHTDAKIKIFPLADISEIETEDKSA